MSSLPNVGLTTEHTLRRLALVAPIALLLAGCLEYNDPVQRQIGKGLAYLLAAVAIAALVIVCLVLARFGRGELVWLLLGLVSFLLAPVGVRTTIYSIFLAGFGFGSLLLVLFGEFQARPPPFIKATVNGLIPIGLLLIVPWGIGFALKYGLSPFLSSMAAPPEGQPGSGDYVLWFLVKVVALVGGSRLLDLRLERRGMGVLARVTLRNLLIWGLGLVPFPHVFGNMWGEMLASAAPSTMIDGAIDCIGQRDSGYRIFAGVALAAGALLALPGTNALYADVLSPALGIIISAAFTWLASRVFFLQIKYGMIASSENEDTRHMEVGRPVRYQRASRSAPGASPDVVRHVGWRRFAAVLFWLAALWILVGLLTRPAISHPLYGTMGCWLMAQAYLWLGVAAPALPIIAGLWGLGLWRRRSSGRTYKTVVIVSVLVLYVDMFLACFWGRWALLGPPPERALFPLGGKAALEVVRQLGRFIGPAGTLILLIGPLLVPLALCIIRRLTLSTDNRGVRRANAMTGHTTSFAPELGPHDTVATYGRRTRKFPLLVISVVAIVVLSLVALVRTMRAPQPYALSVKRSAERTQPEAKSLRMEVVNGSGFPRVGRAVADEMQTRGFDVYAVRELHDRVPRTTVVDLRDPTGGNARVLARALRARRNLVPDTGVEIDSSRYLEVRLLVGADYRRFFPDVVPLY